MVTLDEIKFKQEVIADSLKKIHPDDPIAYVMRKLYRELEQSKNELLKQ